MDDQRKHLRNDLSLLDEQEIVGDREDAFSDWLHEEGGGLPIAVYADGRVTCGPLRRFDRSED